MIVVFVPGTLVNPLNRRWHWSHRARWARQWRRDVKLVVGDAMNRARWSYAATTPKSVFLTARVGRLMDWDGLVAALKPVYDGLVDAKVIHDDGPESGHRFVPPAQSVDRRRGVLVEVGVR